MAKIHHERDWAEARRKDYPSWTELADALFHERNGDPAPMQAYLSRVKGVKVRHPKPRASSSTTPGSRES